MRRVHSLICQRRQLLLKASGSDDQPLMVGLASEQPNGDFCVRVKTDLLKLGRELKRPLTLVELDPVVLPSKRDFAGVLMLGQGQAVPDPKDKALANWAREQDIAFLGLGTGFYAALESFAENVLCLKSDLFLPAELFRTAKRPVFNVAYQGPFIEHGWQILSDSEEEHLALLLAYRGAHYYRVFYDLPFADDQTELAKCQSLWHDCLIDFIKAMAGTVTDWQVS